MEKIAVRLGEISGGKILDIATGKGEFVHLLASTLKNFTEIIGIDTSDFMLELAKKNLSDNRIKFINMDAKNLQFADQNFNIVSISNSLHHFNNLKEIMDEMKRILKPDGFFIVNEMYCDEDQSEAQKNHISLHHWCSEIDTRQGIIHKRTYTRNQIKKILQETDLKDVEIYDYTFPMENSHDPEIITRLWETIDKYIEKISTHPDYLALKQQGELLKENLNLVGFAPASILLIIARKSKGRFSWLKRKH
ncbi:MAG: methyltransferase domain-containing protein [Candidatus Cloacimonetes bacterium]|nr:methyltransferase domain-containing protein [Candidatus Cloacimonadota bacterium]